MNVKRIQNSIKVLSLRDRSDRSSLNLYQTTPLYFIVGAQFIVPVLLFENRTIDNLCVRMERSDILTPMNTARAVRTPILTAIRWVACLLSPFKLIGRTSRSGIPVCGFKRRHLLNRSVWKTFHAIFEPINCAVRCPHLTAPVNIDPRSGQGTRPHTEGQI